MQTSIVNHLKNDPEIQLSEAILRTCVHCGFCNATCPTYQVMGSELEGPRGRVYMIKSLLEERVPQTQKVVEHLDHCLGCLACMTTCPSGVNYVRLIDAARIRIEKTHKRPIGQRVQRAMLALLLPRPGLFRWALRGAKLARPFAFMLPGGLKTMVRMAPSHLPKPAQLAQTGKTPHVEAPKKKVALLTGCAQQVLGPEINDATVRVLNRLGAEVVVPQAQGCCGALNYHLGKEDSSLPLMKNNIDVWHREITENGLEYIVINTSGCGAVIAEYGHIFENDPAYAEKAKLVSERAKDISEVVLELGIPKDLVTLDRPYTVAYHDACSLQHAQKIKSPPRDVLKAAGFVVLEPAEPHLCCGSAGTYNMLQPEIATELGQRKAKNLDTLVPDFIVAGNIGCMEQIAQYSENAVGHTVQLVDWATGGPVPKFF